MTKVDRDTNVPCKDTISREDAIRIVDGIDTWQAGWRDNAIESIKALPSAQPEPKWIPCSERLPEDRIYVLVTFEYRYGLIDHGIAWYSSAENQWFPTRRNVTAWMPLPEPYREEGEQE